MFTTWDLSIETTFLGGLQRNSYTTHNTFYHRHYKINFFFFFFFWKLAYNTTALKTLSVQKNVEWKKDDQQNKYAFQDKDVCCDCETSGQRDPKQNKKRVNEILCKSQSWLAWMSITSKGNHQLAQGNVRQWEWHLSRSKLQDRQSWTIFQCLLASDLNRTCNKIKESINYF